MQLSGPWEFHEKISVLPQVVSFTFTKASTEITFVVALATYKVKKNNNILIERNVSRLLGKSLMSFINYLLLLLRHR